MALLVGCSDNSIRVYPTTGVVTYKGKPLENALVNFMIHGKEGQPSMVMGLGTTDAEGRFTIETTVDPTEMPLKGAVEGEHAVVISKYIPPKGMTEEDLARMMARETKLMEEQGFLNPEDVTPTRVPLLPPKYHNPAMSELKANVVPGEENHFVFDLE